MDFADLVWIVLLAFVGVQMIGRSSRRRSRQKFIFRRA